MQSLRRAALRSAVSASRAAAPKAPTPSIAARFAKNSSVVRATALSASRCFSQSARLAVPESSDGAGAQSQGGTMPPGEAHGVFVRNLAFDVVEADLQEAFSKFGTINRVSVARDARGLSRGYAFAFFSTAEEAERAIQEANGTFWRGRQVHCSPRTARRPMDTGPKEPSSYLYIGNIPYDATDDDLNRVFRNLSNVKHVRVAVDRVTGWPRGFAHADFTDVESAERAYNYLTGMQMGDRTLRVDYTTENPNRSRSGPGSGSREFSGEES